MDCSWANNYHNRAMTTPSPAPGAGSKRLRQLRWALVAIGIVALAIISDRGGRPNTDNPGDDDGGSRRCTVTVIADVLNVRAGPGTQHPTVDQLSGGAVVDAEPETSDGFRKLAENRWVSSQFVRPSPDCD
jgi:uncharacterized protein YgiM (DUF1202 family)